MRIWGLAQAGIAILALATFLSGPNQEGYAVDRETLQEGNRFMVVFHVDEIGKWGLALTNIANLLEAAGQEGSLVELVANAEAVKGFLDPALVSKMEPLAHRGVRFIACQNALRGYQVREAYLPSFVNIVQAGVVELVQRQNEGYAYLKP
jgi:intracellular sulfur oxidation DsrE/DsrF family protein